MTDTATLAERTAGLDRAVGLSRGRLADATVDNAAALADKIRGRLGHGTDHTVIALAGPTGAGKSSLFNALTGEQLSEPGVRRPTTSSTHACTWGDPAAGLLDWLAVPRRHHLQGPSELDGLVLLDLPDHDSTAAEHRIEVDRLVELVDLLIWVVDPQKYADLALHEQYLRPLAGHGDIMRFVLNKVDLLDAEQRLACTTDLGAKVADSGIVDAQVFPVAVNTGEGLPELRELLRREVAEREAVVDRLDADLRQAAVDLDPGGDRSADVRIDDADRGRLVEGLARAAGSDAAAATAAAQHRRDAAVATGWPPTRLARRWRRQPLADLHQPGASVVAEAEVAAALRELGEAAGADLGAPWPQAVRRAAQDRGPDVLEALGGVTNRTARSQRTRPAWWSAVKAIQGALILAAVVGIVWLIVLAATETFFRFDTDALAISTPGVDWLPVPSLLVLGGVILGIAIALLSRIPAAIGAKRRARRVRAAMRDGVVEVAQTEVIDPIETVLAEHRELRDLLAVVAGTTNERV